MTPFHPQDMERSRGQVLYRYRPGQTFDHPGGWVAHVRQYGRDDSHQGARLDPDHLIAEAMNFVRRWRAEGRQAPDAEPGSDRAPEFPDDLPLAHRHYEVVIPGKVYCRVWPLIFRCSGGRCGKVWETTDPRSGVDPWPPACPRCGSDRGNRQLQYVFVHACGEIVAMTPPRDCPQHHRTGFRLNDQVSRFQDFRWECLECSAPQPVRAFCPNRTGCRWSNKMMAPQVHTASSAYSGHGRTLVNVPREEFARLSQTPGFVVGTLARWLGECSEEEARSLQSGGTAENIAPEVIDSIRLMENSGVATLIEQARVLRRKFFPVNLDQLRERVQQGLGLDPLGEDGRGRLLADQVGVFERVLSLPKLTVEQVQRNAITAGRAGRYENYSSALRRAGMDPERCMLVNEFPVIYLAVGYTRGGFGAREADLVAYKGRAGRGQAVTNLLYASPTDTEALVFGLDRSRVARWLVANRVATEDEIRNAGGAHRWFAARLDPADGQLPGWDPEHVPVPGDPDFAARTLFRLLHSAAHQVLRALAVDSGYSETALSEYLFPYELSFAIHPNGGSEFTIGGLRTVLEQNLDEVVDRAVENATCIYDPNCMVANQGADHGCLQLPETACQSWNRFISRWDLFGSPEGEWIGYWDPALGEP